jgi:hypothetical protein
MCSGYSYLCLLEIQRRQPGKGRLKVLSEGLWPETAAKLKCCYFPQAAHPPLPLARRRRRRPQGPRTVLQSELRPGDRGREVDRVC